MIAMQYSFTLPADYDMSIIEQRIAEKGPMLDAFPHLRLKAYLSVSHQDHDIRSAENLYAPFYVWDEPEGISNFLCGSGFGGLTQAFGWPKVQTWLVWAAEHVGDVRNALFASRDIASIPPYADLRGLRSQAMADAKADMAAGALASVSAFDPMAWSFVRFQLWADIPPETNTARQLYRVGHVSQPGVHFEL